MICTHCGKTGSKVIDKRDSGENNSIRRRRECLNCGTRFTTYEKIENSGMLVKKKSGRIEEFDRSKLKNSVIKGLKKRHVSEEKIDDFIDKVELKLLQKKKTVIDSCDIGDIVLEGLRDIDKVAYMLYATVYRDFETINDIEKTIHELKVQK